MVVKILRGLLASVFTTGWGAALALVSSDGNNALEKFTVLFFITFFAFGIITIFVSDAVNKRNNRTK